jgi:hypothetical protein
MIKKQFNLKLNSYDRDDLAIIAAYYRIGRYSDVLRSMIARERRAIDGGLSPELPTPPPRLKDKSPQSTRDDDLSEAQRNFKDDLGQVMLDDEQLAALERACDARQMNAYEVVTEIIGTYIVDFLKEESEPTMKKKLVKF